MSAAQGPWHKDYIDGRLAMAGINMRSPLKVWLDAAYAMLFETPVDEIKKLESALSARDAMIDPVATRETWGLTPQHQALTGSLANTAVPRQ
jgi:hypothetical protein